MKLTKRSSGFLRTNVEGGAHTSCAGLVLVPFPRNGDRRTIGGSSDATWFPGHRERSRPWRPDPRGAEITAYPAAPGAARRRHRGRLAGDRRADRRLVREVAAATGR